MPSSGRRVSSHREAGPECEPHPPGLSSRLDVASQQPRRLGVVGASSTTPASAIRWRRCSATPPCQSARRSFPHEFRAPTPSYVRKPSSSRRVQALSHARDFGRRNGGAGREDAARGFGHIEAALPGLVSAQAGESLGHCGCRRSDAGWNPPHARARRAGAAAAVDEATELEACRAARAAERPARSIGQAAQKLISCAISRTNWLRASTRPPDR